MEYIILGILLLFLIGIGVMLKFTLPIAVRVYKSHLTRASGEDWGYACSAPDNEEQMEMWNEGILWGKENEPFKTQVDIENDGLKLHGEYYDFGSKNCVIILPGRCECLKYSYYFAQPYKTAGYNVLVIDNRAHGKSEGVYSTIGKKEGTDVLAWSRFIIENYGTEKICLHSICIGSVSAITALTSKKCPPQLCEFVTEGCFTTFRESFKQHMIKDKRPLFPVLDLVMLLIYIYTGTNVIATSPIAKIGKVKARTLFLYSEKDIFSRPVQVKRLYKKSKSKDKRLVCFKNGSHSHVRINNKEIYDKSIVEFLNES